MSTRQGNVTAGSGCRAAVASAIVVSKDKPVKFQVEFQSPEGAPPAPGQLLVSASDAAASD